MQLWNEITRLGIIGLSNVALPKNVSNSIHSLGLKADSDTALLLEGLSAISVLKKTQIQPKSINLEEVQFAAFESENHIGQSKVLPILKRILHLGEYAIINEYGHLCKKYKHAIAAELWPRFFELALRDSLFLKIVKPYFNQRARWLIQVNPSWQVLLNEKNGGEEVSFHISVQTYRKLRFQDIEIAKSYLMDAWEAFIYPEKEKILRLIQKHLRNEDLPLINWIAEKNEADISPLVHEILIQIPESTLSFKAAQLIENYTYYHLGFEVIEDNDIFSDAPWAMGFVNIVDSENPIIERYFNIIARLHPQILQKQFDLSLESFFLRARLSSQKKLWIDALINSALLHKDEAWIQAILELHYQYPDQFRYTDDQFMLICESISDQYFKKKTITLLNKRIPIASNNAFLDLIAYSEHFWPKSLTMTFFEKLTHWMHEAENGLQKMWRFEKYLKRAGLKADPNLAKPIRELVLPILNNSYRFSAAFEQFFLLMEIRNDLRNCYQNETLNEKNQ